jgi:hypothetical protein
LNPVFLHNLFLFSSFLKLPSTYFTSPNTCQLIHQNFITVSATSGVKVDRTSHKSANTQQTAFPKSLDYHTQLKRKSLRSKRIKTYWIICITLPTYITNILFFYSYLNYEFFLPILYCKMKARYVNLRHKLYEKRICISFTFHNKYGSIMINYKGQNMLQ